MPGVFPTPVGVFPTFLWPILTGWRLPHARGGVSGVPFPFVPTSWSSPRPWGCFTPSTMAQITAIGLPHARGGVSLIISRIPQKRQSSPRPWGCFQASRLVGFGEKVFPTPVGVFLRGLNSRRLSSSLPHARGGVSKVEGLGAQLKESSPRPWGCFS